MKYLRERCGDEMFIVESIAPLFPYQYANARRISVMPGEKCGTPIT